MSKTATKVAAIIFTVLCALLILMTTVDLSLFPMATLDNTVEVKMTIDSVEKFGSSFTFIRTEEHPNQELTINDWYASNLEALNDLSSGDIIIARVYTHVVDNRNFGNMECFGLRANGKTIISSEDALKEKKKDFLGIMFACIFWIVVFFAIATVCFCAYKGVLGGRKNENAEPMQY